MKLINPGNNLRLNEAVGIVLFTVSILAWLSLISYHPQDPSFNTASAERVQNLAGSAGAHGADLLLQAFGAVAFLFPLVLVILSWRWIRSVPVEAPVLRLGGLLLLVSTLSCLLALLPGWKLFGGAIMLGGVVGMILAAALMSWFNTVGTWIVAACLLIVALYLTTSVSLHSGAWLDSLRNIIIWPWRALMMWWNQRQLSRLERGVQELAKKAEPKPKSRRRDGELMPPDYAGAIPETALAAGLDAPEEEDEPPPWEEPVEPEPVIAEIPIRVLDDAPAAEIPVALRGAAPGAWSEAGAARAHREYQLPSTTLLNEPPVRSVYDDQELQITATRIKAKFEEFNVRGAVMQINPGPVVTTFEFKPDSGVKYSRITTLTEDLCLGLQAESILIERLPGKPTVGIEVPNSRREVISLRQILESSEFQDSPSCLTVCLGKDINGKIKVARLETMPHLLIAGSTGSGKSVMLNSLIMSVLYKSTPDQVRLILVDPKRLEMGLYEGVPHLLTPVITDAKKATIALRNAVLEMERRTRLLAAHGARNIEQFNAKMLKLQQQPRSLFDEEDAEELQPIPYILVVIDELADLMMVERANVEESVTRLAQMARAVGMHLVVATQRPSVDVITGLIKANFPARVSFRVATRVDSRTILDVMGAEHLLGKGDMLFLPPGSARLVRVHGALVTESEINRVVDCWKEQARPDYDATFLLNPEADDEAGGDGDDGDGDPLYEDAVRVVVEMGKASTSTLQRRLRLGYGRAARILDRMFREGIIGPPDGSRPRDVMRVPDWVREVDVR